MIYLFIYFIIIKCNYFIIIIINLIFLRCRCNF